jgi:hypothetical protein
MNLIRICFIISYGTKKKCIYSLLFAEEKNNNNIIKECPGKGTDLQNP